jgi:hypothetical protein
LLRALNEVIMKFDIFGKKVLEVVRSDNQWLAFYCGNGGVKRKANDIRIPPSLGESELDGYIADVFHEWATLDRNEIKRV